MEGQIDIDIMLWKVSFGFSLPLISSDSFIDSAAY